MAGPSGKADSRLAGPLLGQVHDDPGLLQRDEPPADHPVELGQDGVDLLLGVDALDDQRKIDGEAQDLVAVQPRGGPEAQDGAAYRRSGVVPLPEEAHDRLVERLALPLVALPDVNPHEDTLSDQAVHVASDQMRSRTARSSLAATRPSSAAPTESATDRKSV